MTDATDTATADKSTADKSEEAKRSRKPVDQACDFDSGADVAALNKVLVILSPDLVSPDAPLDSDLINRAVSLARAAGCELELFHVCYDHSVSPTLFLDDEQLRQAQQECVDRDATLMSELIARLDAKDVTIRQDVRWDTPRLDAMLRKIRDAKPDLVMKQAREHTYVMGLTRNNDWDLVRQSPAHLWFVTEHGRNRIERLVSAVGTELDADEVIGGPDYRVFRLANQIAAGFKASNHPVHAYQVPQGLQQFARYAPAFGETVPPISVHDTLQGTTEKIARRHGRSIEAFAQIFQIDPGQVQLAEGHASQVLPQVARSLEADVLFMAARNLSRWERFVEKVTAEPVLAQAPCDLVFVKDAEDVTVPEADRPLVKGVPAYDLERAVMDPQRVFGSPQELAQASQISEAMRKRILQIWERDILAQMVEEDEGGPVRATTADMCEAIERAKAELAAA